MNKLILPAFLCLLGFSSLAQVSNGGFEDWNKLILFEHPNTGMNTMSSNYDTFFANGELNVNRIETEDNSTLRIENMDIDGNVVPGFYLFGNLPVSEGEMLTFGGGIEMTDLSMTGITMDLKMDIPIEKPGFVMVQFKSEGMPVGNGNHSTGTYVFPLSGVQDWTNVEFTFDEEIDPSVDQCVIGLSCADPIGEDAPFAPESYMELDNIEWMDSDVEVAGGNFESWTYVAPIFVPKDCNVDVDPFDLNFEDSPIAFEGLHALGLHTMQQDETVNPATAVMGDVDEMGTIVPTIVMESNHSIMSFMYSYNGVGEDVAQATVVFYSENEGEYSALYTHKMDLPSTGGYQLMEYNFEQDMNADFAEASMMSITFESSKTSSENTPQEGSFLLVDEVSLSGTLGIFDRVNKYTELGVLSYPNPTMGRVEFNFGARKTGYFRVINPSGVQIDTKTYSNKNLTNYDMTDLPAGSYLFKFYHTSGFQSARVMKL